MIVEFAVKNFLSFKDEVVFSMAAAASVKEMESGEGSVTNVFTLPETGNRYLRVASVYGANGSGKSNLVKAMAFFKNMVLGSVTNDHILSGFSQHQFLLEDRAQETSGFEMVFFIGPTRYRYGFEILGEEIDSEWLFRHEIDSQKESYCFKREKGSIQVNVRIFKEGRSLDVLTRKNALFLSTAAQFNVAIALSIREWFSRRFNILSGISDETLNYTAMQYMSRPQMRERILDFIRIIDLGIQDISVKERLIDSLGESTWIPDDPLVRKVMGSLNEALNPAGGKIRELDILAEHNKYQGNSVTGSVQFPFRDESIGTIKIFALIGPWLDTMQEGGTLIVDEFGASIHTKLSLELVRLFQSGLNRGNAQLIFTTHDTNLLRRDLLRRDQIWFAEKDQHGVSDLYSLVEYKINQATSVRNDASFEKDYLLGKYGAIPYFGNIERFIAEYGVEEKEEKGNGEAVR